MGLLSIAVLSILAATYVALRWIEHQRETEQGKLAHARRVFRFERARFNAALRHHGGRTPGAAALMPMTKMRSKPGIPAQVKHVEKLLDQARMMRPDQRKEFLEQNGIEGVTPLPIPEDHGND